MCCQYTTWRSNFLSDLHWQILCFIVFTCWSPEPSFGLKMPIQRFASRSSSSPKNNILVHLGKSWYCTSIRMYQVEDSQCEVTQVVEARYGLQNLTRRRGWHGGRSFGAELRVVGKSVTPQRLPNGVPNLRMEKKTNSMPQSSPINVQHLTTLDLS